MLELKQSKEGKYLEGDEWLKLELNQRNIFQAKWFRDLPLKIQAMVKKMVEHGYWFFTQTPYLQLVEVENQDVRLQYTNGYCIVILKKNEGKWQYLCRWSAGSGLSLEQVINMMYELEVDNY